LVLDRDTGSSIPATRLSLVRDEPSSIGAPISIPFISLMLL
jgi:hypothetical protein